MKNNDIIKDERTIAVENSSYRWAYIVLSFGLLLDVAYRGWMKNESSWDLLALIILSGLITTLYQAGKKIVTRRWILWAVVTALIAAVVSAVLILVR
jgi:hypothetical protein